MSTQLDVPESMRVFELARSLEIPASHLVRRLNRVEIETNSVLKSLDQTEMKRVLESYQNEPSGDGPDPEIVEEMLSAMNGSRATDRREAHTPERSGVADGRAPAPAGGMSTPWWRLAGESSPKGADTVIVDDMTSDPEEKPLAPSADGTEETGDHPSPGVDPRRRVLVVGLAIVVGVVVLSLLYAVLRPLYAAQSEVVVRIAGLGEEEIQREMENLNVVAGGQTVLAPVADEFDMSVTDLQESFESSIVRDSTVLRFTMTAGDPAEALARNEAVVSSFLEFVNQPTDQDELAFVESQISSVESQIADVDEQLQALEEQEAANAARRLQVEAQREVAQAQLADLEGRLVDLRASGSPPAGSISYVQGEINETEARLADLVAEAQLLASEDAETTTAADRLRDERAVLRTSLNDLQTTQFELELRQISESRVDVLTPPHVLDGRVGLTPVRAIALGLLVGGALAFAWIVAATQLRKRR